jgi:2-dehydro-3-deoxygalactonokinase
MSEFFIHCDWGTTHLRLRVATVQSGEFAGECCWDEGIARIARRAPASHRAARFREALAGSLQLLGQRSPQALAALPIVISGMASSSIGWQELPYAHVPWRLDGADLVWRELEPLAAGSSRHRVLLISGVRSATDVMRGEETQALGLYQLASTVPLLGRSVAILPGTHSKHLDVRDGSIVSFQTFMTGELFDVLSRHSILRHSVGDLARQEPTAPDLGGQRRGPFLAGVRDAGTLPLSAMLFRARTRQVLDGADAASNADYLSGLLIGAELSYLAGAEHRETPLILCAGAAVATQYAAACEALGLAGRLTLVPPADVERLSALGQCCLLRRLGLA